jgi:hypothetical protein
VRGPGIAQQLCCEALIISYFQLNGSKMNKGVDKHLTCPVRGPEGGGVMV